VSAATGPLPEGFRRSLRHLSQYRLFLVFILILGVWAFPHAPLVVEQNAQAFLAIAGLYGLAALVLASPAAGRWPFAVQLYAHEGIDIAGLSALMALAGGNESGFGLLLMVPLAAAGMLPRLRDVLLVAALASLVLMAEHAARALWGGGGADGFVRAGALSIGFFSVGLLSRALAKGVEAASLLADEKTRLAEQLGRVNARVIHELPFGVLVVDAAGRVILANSQAEALLQGRFQGQCSLERCSPRLAALWEAWLGQGKAPTHPFQVNREGPRLRARFMELEADRQAGAIVVLEDMTELEAEAQKMKLAALGRLTANLAHEIRNPLSAINHAAELLKEGGGAEVQARLCRIIEDNAQRLNRLVDDVLSLNRRDRVDREALALEAVLEEFRGEFERNQQVPPGILVMSVAAGLEACFDRMHLQQILWNLCRNAWHYCRKRPGSIRLVAAPSGAGVDIDVFNDGPPVSDEMQLHLFEPFYTSDRKGTGLGLYISRELAEANDARLHYVGRPEGALFRLSCQAPPC